MGEVRRDSQRGAVLLLERELSSSTLFTSPRNTLYSNTSFSDIHSTRENRNSVTYFDFRVIFCLLAKTFHLYLRTIIMILVILSLKSLLRPTFKIS